MPKSNPHHPQDDPQSDGFDANAAVVVEQVDDTTWEVKRSFSYQGKHQRFTVPEGMKTDFASVPRVFAWYLPRYGKYTRAAILHDHLWEKAQSGDIDYVDADGTFRRAMRELGVPFLHRWFMWAAVRWAALFKPNGTKGWLREAWRVVLVTLMALPLLLPPAVIVTSALAILFVVEAALFLPLKGSQVAKGRKAEKAVNPPRLRWKL